MTEATPPAEQPGQFLVSTELDGSAPDIPHDDQYASESSAQFESTLPPEPASGPVGKDATPLQTSQGSLMTGILGGDIDPSEARKLGHDPLTAHQSLNYIAPGQEEGGESKSPADFLAGLGGASIGAVAQETIQAAEVEPNPSDKEVEAISSEPKVAEQPASAEQKEQPPAEEGYSLSDQMARSIRVHEDPLQNRWSDIPPGQPKEPEEPKTAGKSAEEEGGPEVLNWGSVSTQPREHDLGPIRFGGGGGIIEGRNRRAES